MRRFKAASKATDAGLTNCPPWPQSAAARRQWEAAAAWAQVAANLGWFWPGGFAVSQELESTLANVAAAVPLVRPTTVPGGRARLGDGRPKRVLHLMTAAYTTGGHTRFACQWVGRDEAEPTVVLTQHFGPVPEALDRAVRKRNGSLYRLPAAMPSLLERAGIVRQLAAQCDVVVLHTHPYDVVPLIALGVEGTPPVILENHSDLSFWLGLSVTDVIFDYRPNGQAFTRRRRGVPEPHMALLPIPIDPPQFDGTRESARRELGLSASGVLAVSTAPGYKSQPLEGFPGLLDVVLPSVLKHRQMALIAVGTPPDEAWAKAQEQAGGRLAAVGTLTDWSRIMQAADIYVDSIPVGSETSMLEAAASGLPPVSVAGFSGECILFSCNSPGLEHGQRRGRWPQGTCRRPRQAGHRPRFPVQARPGSPRGRAVHPQRPPLVRVLALRLFPRAAVAGRIQMNELVPEAASPGYNRMLLAFNHNAGLVVPLANVIAGHPLQLGALMGPGPQLTADVEGALHSAVAGTQPLQAELRRAQVATVEVCRPPGAPEGNTGAPVPGSAPSGPVTVVAPAGWETHPGFLAATLTTLFSLSAQGINYRLSLPLVGDISSDRVSDVLEVTKRVLRDLGYEDGRLPIKVMLGDFSDEPGHRGTRVHLPLESSGKFTPQPDLGPPSSPSSAA